MKLTSGGKRAPPAGASRFSEAEPHPLAPGAALDAHLDDGGGERGPAADKTPAVFDKAPPLEGGHTVPRARLPEWGGGWRGAACYHVHVLLFKCGGVGAARLLARLKRRKLCVFARAHRRCGRRTVARAPSETPRSDSRGRAPDAEWAAALGLASRSEVFR